MTSSIGLSLHDQVRLTVAGATPYDLQCVMRATGAERTAGKEAPDIEVRFAPGRPAGVAWRRLGDAYCADGRFALGYSRFRSPVPMELPTHPGPAPFRVTYPSGCSHRLPWLRSMINGKCVSKDLLGLHATAFTFAGRGYLVCGWPGGGKTGLLLAYLLQGGQYLAAEWVYASDAGQKMHGVAESIRMRDWHVRQGADQLQHVGMSDRMRLWGRQRLAIGMDRVSRIIGSASPSGGGVIRKFAAAVDRHRFIDRPAAQWIGQKVESRAASIDVIVTIGTHTRADIQIAELNTEVAKRRLSALQEEDWDDLTLAYRRWAYAMSDPSAWLADFAQNRSRLLDQLIAGKAIFAIDHPRDASLAELFYKLEDAVAQACSQSH